MKAFESLNNELGKIESPGIYTLFEGKNKVYIGEAKNIYNRLKTHMTNPEDKIREISLIPHSAHSDINYLQI